MASASENPRRLPAHAVRVFKGVIFEVYQWEQELFDGSFKTFEKLRRNDSSVVIPVLPGGKLLMTEDEQPGRDLVLTFPGGESENGESPEHAARRELLEETGYEAETMTLVRSSDPSSKIAWTIHTFIARGCRKTAPQALDAGERITTRAVTLDELIGFADDPRFQNRELQIPLIKARYDKDVRASLEKLLFG
ncbi:MAG: NUDIX hydrolase [Patescibacteria group bacterium]